LVIKLKFDPTQERLNNIGLPSTIPAGNSAQTPNFKNMSVHYIELAPSAFTQVGKGAIVYKGAERASTGVFPTATDFDKAILKGNNEVFVEIPLKDIPKGTYEYLRASVTYQNYDIKYNVKNIPNPLTGTPFDLNQVDGTIASFVGFNTYINKLKVKDSTIVVNADKAQGFWAFESLLNLPAPIPAPYNKIYVLSNGQANAGATTVVNPINSSSPIPVGSCLVTGGFTNSFTITGEETKNIVINLSFSTNKSVEWRDTNANGQIDIDLKNTTSTADDTFEPVIDMGLRGLKAIPE
jgi:hypothetical protein